MRTGVLETRGQIAYGCTQDERVYMGVHQLVKLYPEPLQLVQHCLLAAHIDTASCGTGAADMV